MDFEALKLKLIAIALAAPRLLTFFATLPILGPDILPALVRNGMVMTLAIFLSPLIGATAADIEFHTLFLCLIKEAVLGLLLAFPISMLFMTPMSVGNILEQQRGGAGDNASDPGNKLESTTIGTVIFQTLVAIFLVSGGMQSLLKGLFASYQVWPAASFFPKPTLGTVTFMVESSARFLVSTLLFAAPFVITCHLVEIGLGFIGRFAQSLNVHYFSMPVKSLLTQLILSLIFWKLAENLTGELGHIEGLFDRILQLVPAHE